MIFAQYNPSFGILIWIPYHSHVLTAIYYPFFYAPVPADFFTSELVVYALVSAGTSVVGGLGLLLSSMDEILLAEY